MKIKHGDILYNKKQCVLALLICLNLNSYSYAVEFNTDLLDSVDKGNIDLSRFSKAGYIMPGTYSLNVRLNNFAIGDQDILFVEETNTNGDVSTRVCLTSEQVNLLGLTEKALDKVKFIEEDKCADFTALQGISFRGDLSESVLFISMPQEWMEYQDSTWLPPSRWEDGIPGVIFDYNLNTNLTKPNSGANSQSASVSGTTGANFGPWRLRGDYQGNYNHTSSNQNARQSNFDWSRFYAYRALTGIMAKLTMGENYLYSNLFDSWRYTGATLASDEKQLPPKLRGYAPEVSGIARTNAKVIITQQNRVIYETTVAAGPFRIRELNSAVNGQLDIRVEEQDGSVQTFQVTTATIPYLTRPGQVRYQMTVGRPSDYDHHFTGPMFSSGEMSWGLTNTWSLYGGGILSEDYQSLALGIGRDLFQFGALSADITQAYSKLPDEARMHGRSYRLSYSKRFDDINSDITFAGYRFSERDYLSMPEYLSARYTERGVGNSKELYTITAGKNFSDWRLSAYLSWSHQTYWNRPESDNYSFTMSQYFDIGDWRNVSGNLSATRSNYNERKDDVVYLSLNIPFGRSSLGYNNSFSNNRLSQSASWYERMDNGDSYRLAGGMASGNGEKHNTDLSGYYSHSGEIADMSANINWSENSYTSGGFSLSGGATATLEGAALHSASGSNSSRILVSTGGVGDVPIGENGATNMFGYAVAPNVSSYYRSNTYIDVNRLPDDIETEGSPVVEVALTEGAIGLRRFSVLKGMKALATIAFSDGSHPPFGASIHNANNQELGMVSDAGSVWLTGINPNEHLTVSWGNNNECTIVLPTVIAQQQLLLPCTH